MRVMEPLRALPEALLVILMILSSTARQTVGQETPASLTDTTATAGDNGLQNLLLLNSLFGGGAGGGNGFLGFGGLGFPGLGGSMAAGLGSLGTGGAVNTLPIIGDYKRFNQVLNGKCIIVGSSCRVSHTVCTAVVESVQNVGVCRCRRGYSPVGGACYSGFSLLSSAEDTSTDTTSFPFGVDIR